MSYFIKARVHCNLGLKQTRILRYLRDRGNYVKQPIGSWEVQVYSVSHYEFRVLETDPTNLRACHKQPRRRRCYRPVILWGRGGSLIIDQRR